MELAHWPTLPKIGTLQTQVNHLLANLSQDDRSASIPKGIHPLRYYFYELNSTAHPILYDFGDDRVAAFSLHRQLERQGKKLSAVQLKKLSGG